VTNFVWLTFTETGAGVSGLVSKVGCGNNLTGDVAAAVKVSGLEFFAGCQDSNVTCESFEESDCPDTSKTKEQK
jgi:hypothetical protein